MKANKVIIVSISILVPIVVALLFVFTTNASNIGSWVYQLPVLNVSINATTFIILLFGYRMIKQGNRIMHRNLMMSAFVLGIFFLVSYITYHASVPSTLYGDIDHDKILSVAELSIVGSWRIIYLVLLLSHILTAVIGLPLVHFAVYHAFTDNFAAHKKIVRFTLPVWLFVSISGVLVFIFISPYY